MVTRQSRYGWMTLGSLLCLLAVVLAFKLRDGNRAEARPAPVAPVPSESPEPPVVEAPPRVLPPIGNLSEDLKSPEKTQPTPPAAPGEVTPAGAVLPNTPTPPAPAYAPAAQTSPPANSGSESRPILIPAGGTVPGASPTPPLPGSVTPPAIPPVQPPAPAAAPGSSLPPVTSAPEPTTLQAPVPVHTPAPPPAAPPVVPPAAENNSSGFNNPQMPAKVEPAREHPGEPPLAPGPGMVLTHKLSRGGETFKTLARKMLGSAERWSDIHKLNPTLKGDGVIPVGTVVRLPGDACIQDEAETLRPLPPLRARPPVKARATAPLTGTYSLTLDESKGLTLPRALQQQLGSCDTVMVSPGSDRCLWLTNQVHLDRLQAKLDKSPARESDVRGFKRLYYAQTVKCAVKEGRVVISDKLAQFASLGAEVVVVGIDDHFEVWDAARWKSYTQTKKAAALTTED